MNRLGPGIYEDGKGEFRVDVPEVLAFLGLENSEENRQIAMAEVERMAEKVFSAPVAKQEVLIECHVCSGAGGLYGFTCGTCGGSGRVTVTRHVHQSRL